MIVANNQPSTKIKKSVENNSLKIINVNHCQRSDSLLLVFQSITERRVLSAAIGVTIAAAAANAYASVAFAIVAVLTSSTTVEAVERVAVFNVGRSNNGQ